MRRHISYANVTASLALFVALGSGSYAAVTLSRNSVRSPHIKNGQVKRADIARNAVDSARVKDGSLLSKDFKPGQLPAGSQGPTGPAGPAGTPDTSAFYTKAQSDSRFLGSAATAVDADKLDGLDSSAFLGAAGKATDADKLDGVDSTGFVQGAGSPLVQSYRRDWADNNGVHRVHDMPGIGTLDFKCADPASGSLIYTNTSGNAVESIVQNVSNTGSVALTQLQTAPGATATVALTSPGQVIWQFGPATYFLAGDLATVTASQVAQPPVQCRIYSHMVAADPVRG